MLIMEARSIDVPSSRPDPVRVEGVQSPPPKGRPEEFRRYMGIGKRFVEAAAGSDEQALVVDDYARLRAEERGIELSRGGDSTIVFARLKQEKTR